MTTTDKPRDAGGAAAYAVYGHSEEYGDVLIPQYVGSIAQIRERVMQAAAREGFKGDFVQRMAELGWTLKPLYPAPSALLAECAALAEDWSGRIAVAYNEYSHGQRAGYEKAARELAAIVARHGGEK